LKVFTYPLNGKTIVWKYVSSIWNGSQSNEKIKIIQMFNASFEHVQEKSVLILVNFFV